MENKLMNQWPFVRITLLLFLVGCLWTSCSEDDGDNVQPETTNKNPQDTSQAIMGSQFWLDDGTVKCTPFSKNFNTVLKLVNVNSDKCYQEFVRPNIAFYFHTGTFGPGNFSMVDKFALSANEVNLSISGYNNKAYRGIAGTVTVSKNSTDTSKWDIEFNQLQLFSSTDSMNHTFTGQIEGV